MKRLLIVAFAWFTFHSAFSQDFTFVFLNRKPDREELPKEQAEKIQAGHMANIERLSKEGKLIAAGPFEGGGGLFIFRSNSVSQVQEWLSTDPGVQAKRWNVEILPYHPRIGSVCAATEPYVMVNYEFIRFSPKGGNADWEAHEKLLQELRNSSGVHIVTEASFGPGAGSILVTKENVMTQVAAHVGEKSGISVDGKKLYIAQGAFCEK